MRRCARYFLGIVFALCMCFGIVACANLPEKTLNEWTPPTYETVNELNTTVDVKPVTVKDSEGTEYVATVLIIDPAGAEVAIENNQFQVTSYGTYTIKYTIVFEGESLVKLALLKVLTTATLDDWSAPVYDGSTYEVGDAVEIIPVSVEDSEDNIYDASVEVLFNGTTVTVTENAFSPNEAGDYTIRYTVLFNGKPYVKETVVSVQEKSAPVLDDWSVPAYANLVEIGEPVTLVPLTVKDSDGNDHQAVITVTKDGSVVSQENDSFRPNAKGEYKITYTVNNDSKSVTVTAAERVLNQWTAPALGNATVGEEFLIQTLTVSDNFGKTYSAVISVKDAAGKEVSLKGNAFTPMMSGIYDVTYAVTFEEVTKPETVQLYVTGSPFSFSVKNGSDPYASIDDNNTVSFKNVGSTDPNHKFKGLKFNGGTVNSDLYDSLLIEVENLSGDGTDTGDFVLCFALKGDNKEYYKSITVTNVDGIQRFIMLIPEDCTSLENSEVFINSDDNFIANTTEGRFTLSVAYFKAPTVNFIVPEYSGSYFTGDEIEILPAVVSGGLEYSVSVSFGGAIVQTPDGKFKAESAGEYIISYQTTIYGEEVTRSVRINVTELALNDWDAPNYSDKVYYEDDSIEVKSLGSVADNKGNQHDVTVEVSFQTNAEASSESVAWENGPFIAKAGIYTITYSVQLNGDTPSEVKTVTINVTDRILDWEAPDYNQEVKVNTEVSLRSCTPKDNAGKAYTTEITVYLKNGDSEMKDITETMVKDGVFTPSQIGSYVITYTLFFQGETQKKTAEVTVVDEEALVLDAWSAPVYDGTYYETKKIQLQSVTVNDSEDSPHVADITVTKDGADVTSEMVSEGFFTPTIAGDYVVSYTITYGSEESEKKEVKTTLIRVQALTLSWNNLPEFEDRFEGDTIIVPTVDVVDNSGAEYKVAIIVKRNGEDVVLDDEENSFEALAGEYTVEYEVTFKGQKTTKSISFNVSELVLQPWSVSDSLLVSVNEAFQVPMPEVLDNAGNVYPVEIKVSGAYNPEIKDGSFTPIRMGMYTISYSVSFKGGVDEKITTVYAVGGALAVKTGQDSGGISVSDAGNNAYLVSFDFNNLGSLVNQYRKISLDGNFSENTYNAIIFRVVYDTSKTGNNNICHLVMENEWKSGAKYTDHYLKDTNAAQIFILPVDNEFKAMQSSIFKSLNIMVNTDGSPVESTKAGSFVMEAYWYSVVTPDLVNAPSYEFVVQGETVNIKEVYADRASDGKLYTSTYVVTGPDGQEVDITNGAFEATQTGVYKIIYTLNGTDESKEYTSTVTCVELELNEWSAPDSSTALKGDTIKIPQIVVSDNAGKVYTASITIKAPNAQESVPADETFTASEIGDYEITYTITWRTAGGEEQSESKTYIITVKDPIVQAKEQGFAELESYVAAKKSAFQDAYSQNALDQIDQALSGAKDQVESAATVEDINAAVQAGKAALDAIVTDVTNRLIFGNVRVVGGDGNNQLTLDKVTIVNDSTTDENTTPGTEIEMKISFKFSADYKGEGIAIAFDILNFEYFNNMHTKNGAVGFDTTGLNFDLKLRYEADTNKGHGVAGEKTLWNNRNNGEEGYYNACSSLGGLQNVTDINTVYLYLMPSGTNAAEGTLTLSWYFKG